VSKPQALPQADEDFAVVVAQSDCTRASPAVAVVVRNQREVTLSVEEAGEPVSLRGTEPGGGR
jgi:hypothetical protein